MSAVDNLNSSQFAGSHAVSTGAGSGDWLGHALDSRGPLVSGLNQRESARGPQREAREQVAKEDRAGYCPSCGNHRPLNPGLLCDGCLTGKNERATTSGSLD